MKKFTFLFVSALFACFVFAADGERVNLWPEGKMPDVQEQQKQAPCLVWKAAPATPNGCCLVLISGGAYQFLSDGHLISAWTKKFTAAGYHCVELVYRTPRAKGIPGGKYAPCDEPGDNSAFWKTAWEDGQRAIRLIRRDAAKRGYDPEKIGTISMSAGSHLATLLATSSLTPAYAPVDELDKTPCHINWAITGAIAYGIYVDKECHPADPDDGTDRKVMPDFKFDAKTAPMCMLHGGRDSHTPYASTKIYRKLRAKRVPAEVHLFSDRKHDFWGYDESENGAAYDHWFDRAVEFMNQLGYGKKLGPEVDLMTRYPNDAARASSEKQDIWPEGKMPNASEKQCKPFIEWHLPKELKTKAIQIIYSGGGYDANSTTGHEVTPMRRFLNEKGMTVVTMLYRTPRPEGLPKHMTAWQDLQRAVRLVRSQAAKRGLDPDRIGIMGSSAGGHLTLMGVTSSTVPAYEPIDELDKLPCNVNWGVAIYPAYALTDGADDVNKNGGNLDEDVFVPEFKFDDKCCPVVFIHGDADGYAAMASVKCWEKLRSMDIRGDVHTLAKRQHCFQFKAAEGTGSYSWMGRVWEFLNHKKLNK